MDKTSTRYLQKCSICNRPLSVAPIYHHVGSVCGRCTKKSLNIYSSSWNRQIVFEKIAQYLSFPCSYEIYGCTSTLPWDSVEIHEKNCTFSRIFCPLSHDDFKNKCFWIDQPANLHNHIREKHRNMIQNPPIFKITSKFKSDIAFCEITDHLFIIILTFNVELKKALCYISGTCSSDEYQCFVSVLSNQSIKPLIIDETKIKQFSINCLNNPDSCLIIDHEDYLKQFSVDELLLTFNIRKEKETDNEFNTCLLDELECPICTEYMKPPIFICQAGHNICEECCKKVNVCPLCRGHFMGGRNYALEALTSKLDYPCVNKQFGCSFVALSEQIENHQNNCQYFGRNCFMKNCGWKGLNTIFGDHLINNHSEKLLHVDEIKIHESSDKNQYYFLLFNDEIFILKFWLNGDLLQFSVFYFERGNTNYIYNLKIIGCSDIGLMVMFTNLCSPVPITADILRYSEHDVTLPLSFLTQFLVNFNKIEFKLSVDHVETPADSSS